MASERLTDQDFNEARVDRMIASAGPYANH